MQCPSCQMPSPVRISRTSSARGSHSLAAHGWDRLTRPRLRHPLRAHRCGRATAAGRRHRPGHTGPSRVLDEAQSAAEAQVKTLVTQGRGGATAGERQDDWLTQGLGQAHGPGWRSRWPQHFRHDDRARHEQTQIASRAALDRQFAYTMINITPAPWRGLGRCRRAAATSRSRSRPSASGRPSSRDPDVEEASRQG